MLQTIIRASGTATNLLRRRSPDARPILIGLAKNLRRESTRSLGLLARRSADVYPVTELQIAIDNLTNSDAVVRRAASSKDWLGADTALGLIDLEIDIAMNLIGSGNVSGSIDAGEVVLRTANLLFAAKQKIKHAFGVVTELKVKVSKPEASLTKPSPLEPQQPHELPAISFTRTMALSSAMLFQIRQSLFPAERMIVGAARRTGQEIRIEAVFDVTGEASSSGVRADPDRLGQAFIAMAESGTYFGLWVHSHPGTGRSATHQSGIDERQQADWLRDYSPDLVSAIVVRDRYIRFWGTAVEKGCVELVIGGGGVEVISAEEHLYRLSC
jgi:hypothetical protein